jgi:hypothetical protein
VDANAGGACQVDLCVRRMTTAPRRTARRSFVSHFRFTPALGLVGERQPHVHRAWDGGRHASPDLPPDARVLADKNVSVDRACPPVDKSKPFCTVMVAALPAAVPKVSKANGRDTIRLLRALELERRHPAKAGFLVPRSGRRGDLGIQRGLCRSFQDPLENRGGVANPSNPKTRPNARARASRTNRTNSAGLKIVFKRGVHSTDGRCRHRRCAAVRVSASGLYVHLYFGRSPAATRLGTPALFRIVSGVSFPRASLQSDRTKPVPSLARFYGGESDPSNRIQDRLSENTSTLLFLHFVSLSYL